MIFTGAFRKDGFDFGAKRADVLEYAAKHVGERFVLEPRLPESRDQRGFYEGGVIALWVYLDGNDHHDSNICKHYHQRANKEFNGEQIIVEGKAEIMGKSSKGQLNKGFIDRVIDHLEEQYGIDRTLVLDPKRYKKFRDEIFLDGAYTDYIDYLVKCGLLKNYN